MLAIVDGLLLIVWSKFPEMCAQTPADYEYPLNLNCTNDYCEPDEDYIDRIASQIAPDGCRWLLIAMHAFVFVLGLVGNSLVCLAVYRNPSMRTVVNYFIVNLAIADLLVILFCLPSTVLWDVTETWFLGYRLCKLVPYLQTVSVSVSVMTLTFISIDRWYAICFPLKFKSTTSRAKKVILLIWLIAFLFDIPDFMVLEVKATHLRVQTILYTQCGKSWSDESERTFTIIKLVLLYFGPLIFMTAAYCQIVRVLWTREIPGHVLAARVCRMNVHSSTGVGNPEGQLRTRRKAAKMLVAVVAMFGICYFPVHLLSILRQTITLPSNQLTVASSLLAHWLCYANSAVNPLIYNFMSGKFRKEFKRTFCYTRSTDSSNNPRAIYKFAGASNLSGQRSQLRTRSIPTMTNNVGQRGLEIMPLDAICIERRDYRHD